MATLGEVIFLKALVLGVGGAVVERYRFVKKRSREQGLPLRYDARTQTHVPDDKFARFEHYGKMGLWIVGVPAAIYMAFVLYVLFAT